MNLPKHYGALLLVILTISAAVGCNSFDLKRGIPWGHGELGQFKRPQNMIAIWTDTVKHTTGKPDERGFGGRIMFFEDEKSDPVKVKGRFEVYAFDESNRRIDDSRPDRKFVFTVEQFKKHYSKSTLGHSYSVWIPWDQVGGPNVKISLIARFIPEPTGPLVVSEQTSHLLPGRELAKQPASAMPDWSGHGPPNQTYQGVAPASYSAAGQAAYGQTQAGQGSSFSGAQPQGAPRMKTTTIPLGHKAPVAIANNINLVNSAVSWGSIDKSGQGRQVQMRQPQLASPPGHGNPPTTLPGLARSGRGSHQAPTSGFGQPALGRAQWQPPLAGWRSDSSRSPSMDRQHQAQSPPNAGGGSQAFPQVVR